MKTVWLNTLAWIAAILAAMTLAVATPTESSVMGRLPSLMVTRFDQQAMPLQAGLSADRTLALIGFDRSHRADIESWIKGLCLTRSDAIPWVRMPVLNDPGDAAGRQAIEERLRTRYANDPTRASVMPVITDRAAFSRAAGLSSTDKAYAVVINRHGEVLARVEGEYNPEKAQTLRATLEDVNPLYGF
ncbi:hypothetical protein RD110_00715 [Rhodoferax koreense]|uniref:Uncharacterized protein n=1 Tax=Rhodoferax koreensis TaxID=1842727 RepID=A0A1P8JQ84_9BURK|nr:hypothetical protein [Rhodoferax koreense]APW35913.1 hypothetical protein RD110_00715 [Rhodoferax koreense]